MHENPELDFANLDWRPWLTASIYLSIMLYYDVVFWKAAVVTAIALWAMLFHYGRRVALMGGVALLFVSLAVWIGAISDPSTWGGLVRHVAEATAANFSAR